ncbi:aryl-alcohol dehydrogenase-like predicted oxidoreductase [Chitinophaga niastensis]|uniref:Aryl-alcohol dehydrogenase-like predicted oxidoreductase n=1 Tax=Chitinophaga niastensis TaxID=536980 RepID=A0A2P8HEN0_CHINA|nr:aldo/keto reductase [Chitinophaga niastensis]PSL44686.1 aryl-alcohol dehydrogenase-like predicted oxidoreductase [Chitinophaga niastensis]
MVSERLVLGTAGLGGVWGKVDPHQSVLTILSALESGIAAIDTAPAYGDAEIYLGQALRQWRGAMPVISSKVGRLKSYAANQGHYDFTDRAMAKSVEDSLRTIGTSCLDILFLHDPHVIPEEDAERIIATLIKFKEQGLAKRLGVGGNWPSWMKTWLDAGIFDVVMEFNRLNASNIIALKDSLPYCLARNIQYYAASPLNMGLLGRCIGSFKQMRPEWLPIATLEIAMRLEQIAAKHQLTLPAMAHRFLLSLPYDFNIVLGPSDKLELDASIENFNKGKLPETILKEILNCSNG